MWGEETYLLERLLDDTVSALTADAGAMRDFNLDTLDGTAVSAAEVITVAETMPMGSAYRSAWRPAFCSTSSRRTKPATSPRDRYARRCSYLHPSACRIRATTAQTGSGATPNPARTTTKKAGLYKETGFREHGGSDD